MSVRFEGIDIVSDIFKNEQEDREGLSLAELQEFYYGYVQKAVETNKIDEGDFDSQYSAEEIEADKREVRDMQLIFEKSLLTADTTVEEKEKRQKLDILAKALEAICSDHTVLSRAFGMKHGGIKAQSANDYDDIFNSTDLLLEFPREKTNNPDIESYCFGVDVTISKPQFKKKLADLYQRRFRSYPKLTPVKYFQESAYGIDDARLPKVGKTNLPHYIINARPVEMIELIDGWKLWRDQIHSAVTSRDKIALLERSKLTKSKLWYRILYQLQAQAYEFHKHFEGEQDERMSAVYRKNYILFSKLRANLIQKYIDENEEWENKYLEISRDKDSATRQARMDFLKRKVHEEYCGEDMGNLVTIIKNHGIRKDPR